MPFLWSTSILLLVGLLLAGCQRSPSTVPSKAAAEPVSAGAPQPKLPTIKLWLGKEEIVAEQASRPEEIRTGMMFRKEMGENEGMLFIFSQPQQVSFWMRNTLIPLSCAYLDGGGTVLEIHDMKPRDETPIPAASDQVQYVLEMKQGWFARHQISPGAVMRTERGSLGQTYFGRP